MSWVGKKPFGIITNSTPVMATRREENKQCHELMPQHDVEPAAVAVQQRVEPPFDEAIDAAMLAVVLADQEARRTASGVSVSDTTTETTIAAVTVMANSRNRRPTMPPISNSGMKHRDQRDADRHDGEADLARALEGRVQRRRAVLDMAEMFSTTRWRRRPRSRPRSSAPSATDCRG